MPAFTLSEMTGVSFAWDRSKAWDSTVVSALEGGAVIENGMGLAAIHFAHGNKEANVKVDPQPSVEIMLSTDNWRIRPHAVEGIWQWTLDAVHQTLAPLFPPSKQ